MKTVYFKTGEAEWKFQLEDSEYDQVIQSIIDDEIDRDEMRDESIEVLRDVSSLADDEMDEDDQMDQTISVSFLWYYFNTLPEDKGRIDGDIVLIEDDEGDGVSVLAASDITEG